MMYHIKLNVLFDISFFSWFLKNTCHGLSYTKGVRRGRGDDPKSNENSLKYPQMNWIKSFINLLWQIRVYILPFGELDEHLKG